MSIKPIVIDASPGVPLSSPQVLSASDKPRLAGRQPSLRRGAPGDDLAVRVRARQAEASPPEGTNEEQHPWDRPASVPPPPTWSADRPSTCCAPTARSVADPAALPFHLRAPSWARPSAQEPLPHVHAPWRPLVKFAAANLLLN